MTFHLDSGILFTVKRAVLMVSLFLALLAVNGTAALVWTVHESDRQWWSIAASADGTKLIAAPNGDSLYTSTNSGITWTARETNRSWRAVASSADGSKLVAVAYTNTIYTSGDSGATWTTHETNRQWNAVASSADGTKLIAAANYGSLYRSTDSGATWTWCWMSGSWAGVASSADGCKLVAVQWNGPICTSTDSGTNWTEHFNSLEWLSVASSADGSRLIAVVAGGQVYTSTDAGLTWTASESGGYTLRGTASSGDGRILAAVDYGGKIYICTNGDEAGPLYVAVQANHGANGTISPDGAVFIAVGSNATFTATPAPNYSVNRWYLDGSSVKTGSTSYILSNIQTSHTVHVTFLAGTPAVIYASAGPGGAISPSGTLTNWTGQSRFFTAIPAPRYFAYKWYVDGTQRQSGGTSFTWVVTSGSSHTVRVTFRHLPVQPFSDYNGDHVSDLAVYGWGSGKWYIQTAAAGSTILNGQKYGFSGALPVPGDYNGDGVWDLAVYGLSTGNWYIRSIGSSQSILSGYNYGFNGAVPVSGDYNGDGIWDLAVYELATGKWYIRSLAGAGQTILFGVKWGYQGAIPVSGDFNGDGIWDLAVYDALTGNWYIALMGVTPTTTYKINYGFNGAIAVPGDYDGNGICDLAVYDTAKGNWYARPLGSPQPILNGLNYGFDGAVPVPGDFNGDGIYDLAVYDRATGNWYIRPPGSPQPIVSGRNWGSPYTGPGGAQGMMVVNSVPPAGTVKEPYSYQFVGTGGQPPYTFTKTTGSAFPPLGLILAPNGVLSGTPSVAGTYTFSVTMKGLCGSAVNQVVTITINPYNPDPWSGTWVGSYSYTSSAGSCTYSPSGALTLHLSWANNSASGTAQFSSIECRNTSTCEITGYGGVSGSASAWTSGDTINISTSGSVDSGPCSGQSLGYGLTGTRSGITITGSFSDGRSGTFTLTRTGP